MAATPSIAADIAEVDRLLAEPDCGFSVLRQELNFLLSVAQTREFLLSLREGLEDARDGNVVSHEEVVRDFEERRRRYRPDAAE